MSRSFDVVDLPVTDHVAVGDTAPGFTRPLVNEEYWEDTSLTALLADSSVLLVFHPMDGDFPATYIWNELRDRTWDEDHAVTIVGLSISSPYEHSSFIDERGIDYRLFSDPQNHIAGEYGIVNDLDGMTGISEPRPAVFLIGEDREIRYAWVASKWPAFPDYDDIESVLDDN